MCSIYFALGKKTASRRLGPGSQIYGKRRSVAGTIPTGIDDPSFISIFCLRVSNSFPFPPTRLLRGPGRKDYEL
jgi:hypothetical protein